MDVANQAQRKMLIDTFVNAIFLYDDKVVLTYNFHEERKRSLLKNFKKLQKQALLVRIWFHLLHHKRKLGESAELLFCKLGKRT